MNLYDKYAKEFSQTRQNPWKGWEQVSAELKSLELGTSKNPLRVLDLGCGNGRFLKFLAAEGYEIENYFGVDNSNLLLYETKELTNKLKSEEKVKEGKIFNIDLNTEDWESKIHGEFNVVVSFGVMHHINPFDTRKSFLSKAFNILEPNGLLAVSYWQFGALPRYQEKKESTDKNAGTKYSEHDFILNFGSSKAKRFCHFVNGQELIELEDGMKYKDSKTFLNDGREDNENLYRIYTK